MKNQTLKYNYQSFGLTISSEIELQELIPTNQCENVDVKIRKEHLYEEWLAMFPEDEIYIIEPNKIMFLLREKVIFSILNGNEIIFSQYDDEPMEDFIRLYLLGSCMGAILLQRKILPLHGSAIEINGKAYCILGERGAGKSTLAKAFLNKGHRFLTDDVIAINFSEELEPIVMPAYPQQKLWQESLNHYEIESNQFKRLIDRETKFAVPARNQFLNEKLPLGGLFELNLTEGNEVVISEVLGMERFYTVFNQTFRNYFIYDSGLLQWHFDVSTKLVAKTPIYKVERPQTRFTAYEIVDLILSTIQQKVSM